LPYPSFQNDIENLSESFGYTLNLLFKSSLYLKHHWFDHEVASICIKYAFRIKYESANLDIESKLSENIYPHCLVMFYFISDFNLKTRFPKYLVCYFKLIC